MYVARGTKIGEGVSIGRIPTGMGHDNYEAELVGIMEGIRLNPLSTKVTHWTDSESAMKIIERWPCMTHRNKILTTHGHIIEAIHQGIACKKEHGGEYKIRWVKAHQDDDIDAQDLSDEAKMNVEADRLANEGRRMGEVEERWIGPGDGEYVMIDGDRKVCGNIRAHIKEKRREEMWTKWKARRDGWLGRLIDEVGIETEYMQQALKTLQDHAEVRTIAIMLNRAAMTMDAHVKADEKKFANEVYTDLTEGARKAEVKRCMGCNVEIETYEHTIARCDHYMMTRMNEHWDKINKVLRKIKGINEHLDNRYPVHDTVGTNLVGGMPALAGINYCVCDADDWKEWNQGKHEVSGRTFWKGPGQRTMEGEAASKATEKLTELAAVNRVVGALGFVPRKARAAIKELIAEETMSITKKEV